MLLARPEVLAKMLGTDGPAVSSAAWLGRMIGVREIVLGLATTSASRTREDVRPCLLALSLVDAGEGLVLLEAVRQRNVGLVPGLAFVAADAGSAMVGAGVLAPMRRARPHLP